jgi:hypothetical protein
MNHDDILKFNRSAYELAQARMKSCALELTEEDVYHLSTVSSRLEEEARELRRQAQLAVVRPAPAPAALATKAEAPDTIDEFLQRHGKKTVTYVGLSKVLGEITDGLGKAIKALQSRVLELEAQQAAAHPVEPVHR